MADDRVLTFEDLASKGWPHGRTQTWRLVKAGKFPKPFKYHDAGRRNYWLEADVDAFFAGIKKQLRAVPEPASRRQQRK